MGRGLRWALIVFVPFAVLSLLLADSRGEAWEDLKASAVWAAFAFVAAQIRLGSRSGYAYFWYEDQDGDGGGDGGG